VIDALAVGIDVRTFAPVSGQARHMWRLGGWLAGQGHRVHMLSVRPQEECDAPAGVRLHRLHDVSRGELRRRIAGLELDALLLNPERAIRYRGIPANVLRPGYGTDNYRQKVRSFRTPLGSAGRGLLRLAPWVLAQRRWERRFYEGSVPAPDVVANSAYMRAEVLDSYDIPPDHVHVVHNGVDLDEFSAARRQALRGEARARWGIRDDTVCFLFLGHNFRLKGLWEMIGLLPALRAAPGAPDLRVLVAGSGVSAGQVRKAQRLAERNGVGDAVHLLGPVRPAITALAAADVLVHLSWHDSFGFVILEAMAVGMPVVTTRFAGAAELIEDDVSGVIVHPADPGGIAERLSLLLDPAARARLGAAAAATAAAYPEERTFRGVLDVIRTARNRAQGPIQ
jgi:UDP-glucose:(heptosyl)LPS alpha-1,3-glucosyltransferase